ncbi:uncharacterized protein EV422DRAFT_569282 [Fimicolochytrium jonesii]|uniref:uncharacterized protein n=1 Tax=Fimicolochytrium jonesii TaxID=1396493 RepID=UPI0022FEDE2C|nr:uncharacterized protein EV422DRAFT_569282 [Fimicolochytrium jonesii]KAI8819004.1 hypothetical protein EV422DRAFT_569282 [Fimicolochytrium jonesii]
MKLTPTFLLALLATLHLAAAAPVDDLKTFPLAKDTHIDPRGYHCWNAGGHCRICCDNRGDLAVSKRSPPTLNQVFREFFRTWRQRRIFRPGDLCYASTNPAFYSRGPQPLFTALSSSPNHITFVPQAMIPTDSPFAVPLSVSIQRPLLPFTPIPGLYQANRYMQPFPMRQNTLLARALNADATKTYLSARVDPRLGNKNTGNQDPRARNRFDEDNTPYISSTTDLNLALEWSVAAALDAFLLESTNVDGLNPSYNPIPRYTILFTRDGLDITDLTDINTVPSIHQTASGPCEKAISFSTSLSEVLVRNRIPAGNVVWSIEVTATSEFTFRIRIIRGNAPVPPGFVLRRGLDAAGLANATWRFASNVLAAANFHHGVATSTDPMCRYHRQSSRLHGARSGNQKRAYPTIDAADPRMRALYDEWATHADTLDLRPSRRITAVIDPLSCFSTTSESTEAFTTRQCVLVSAALLLARSSKRHHGSAVMYVGSMLSTTYVDNSSSLSEMLVNIRIGTSGEAHRPEYGTYYQNVMHNCPQSTLAFLTHLDDDPALPNFDMTQAETHGCTVAYWDIMASKRAILAAAMICTPTAMLGSPPGSPR